MYIKTSWNYFKYHVLSKNADNADKVFEVIDLIKAHIKCTQQILTNSRSMTEQREK